MLSLGSQALLKIPLVASCRGNLVGTVALVPTQFPLQDNVKKVARQLMEVDADNLRGYVCGILRSACPPPNDNMKKHRQKALKELRSLEDEVILPVDKGNAMVVMKRSDYDEKMRGMLDDTNTYVEGPHHHTGSQDSSYTAIVAQ